MFLILISGACSTSTQQSKLQNDIEQLDREIMTYHDQAMPKMGKILSLRKQINQQIDTCEDEMMKYTLQQLSYQLTKADLDMMKWMHEYRTPGIHDSSIHYLAKQREQIKMVRDQIFSGIEKAEIVIKK
ncbi:MAG: hypothetical protein H7296_14370 [Bacteroidia bacterium]|nr:hypothetical protein [Bacteroidia bacterium]